MTDASASIGSALPGALPSVDVAPGEADAQVIDTTGVEVPEKAARRVREPWTSEQIVVLVVRLVLIGGGTLLTFFRLHPELIFRNTTPTGGDMGAHVWAPAYLRDHLLSSFRLSGWSMDWYSGLPVYRFYMVVPALMIVLLDVVLPYGIAFKIIAVLGILTLPVCCWAFGRLARLPFPVPELLAVAGFIYLWDESYTIYGGNIASTMAGEFSFSIALSLAVLGFGLMIRGLQTGEHRAKAAIVIALAVLCHGIVLIYVVVGLILMGLLWVDRTRLWYWATVCGTGALLSAFWTVPFVLNHSYMTDMKYQGEPGSGSFTSFWDMFFHLPPIWNVFFTTMAFVGLAVSVARRNLVGVWLGVTGLVFVAMVYLFKDSLPVIGLLWNPRLIPMINLCRYFLTAIAVWEVVTFAVRHVQLNRFARAAVAGRPAEAPDTAIRPNLFVAGVATAFAVALITLVCWGWRFQYLPGGTVLHPDGKFQYAWGPFRGPARSDSTNRGFVDSWASWNFKGYEGKEYYGEYRDVVQTMAQIGADQQYGCGRALWENYEDNNKYGTTMALMLLPFWTDGCIGSSEGLFFEASGTTPYHFLAAAAMSKKSSNPVRELRYVDNNAEVGVPELQALGIRYYMAVTPEAVAQADAQAELSLITTAGPWHIYEVADSDIVVPLTTQPVVVKTNGGDARERWLEVGTSWFQHPDEWAALPASDGPAEWQRVEVEPDVSRRPEPPTKQVDIVQPSDTINEVPLDAVTVSDVDVGDSSVSFHVDKINVPVLVRVSYFPNWEVSGAEGPYRVAPNMMVVVPTSNDVKLTFGRSFTDYAAYLLTFFGIIAAVVLWRRGSIRHDNQAAYLTGIEPDDEGPRWWSPSVPSGPPPTGSPPGEGLAPPPYAPPADWSDGSVATAPIGTDEHWIDLDEHVDADVSEGLRLPPSMRNVPTTIDPLTVDLEWLDRYHTETPATGGATAPSAATEAPSEGDDPDNIPPTRD